VVRCFAERIDFRGEETDGGCHSIIRKERFVSYGISLGGDSDIEHWLRALLFAGHRSQSKIAASS
jgi:hypothetical protein